MNTKTDESSETKSYRDTYSMSQHIDKQNDQRQTKITKLLLSMLEIGRGSVIFTLL